MALSLKYQRWYSKYKERRLYAISRLGGKCKVCNTVEDLEFDHIDPKRKLRSIDQTLMLSLANLHLELDKCQLLCKKHHTEKSSKEASIRMKKPLKHGTIYAWSKVHCNCEICLEARRQYRRKKSRDAGTGLQDGLKNHCSQEHTGSNPVPGTK